MTEHDDTPRDPDLSHRYREAGTGRDLAPPPALDARIIAAAREAVQPPAAAPRVLPRPWWQRLTLPVGVVATTLLAVMLSLTVQRQTPETMEQERMAPKTPAIPAGALPRSPGDSAPQRQPAPVTERAERAPPAPAAVQAERIEGKPGSAEKKAMRQAAVPVAPPAPAAFPAPAASEVPAAPPAVPAAPAAIAPAPAVANDAAITSRLKSEATADHAREPATGAPLQKAAPAAAAAPRMGATRGDVTPTASAWIEEIRELRRQGRDAEAARRLAEFRKAYPDYVLPEDLR